MKKVKIETAVRLIAGAFPNDDALQALLVTVTTGKFDAAVAWHIIATTDGLNYIEGHVVAPGMYSGVWEHARYNIAWVVLLLSPDKFQYLREDTGFSEDEIAEKVLKNALLALRWCRKYAPFGLATDVFGERVIVHCENCGRMFVSSDRNINDFCPRCGADNLIKKDVVPKLATEWGLEREKLRPRPDR